MLIGEFGGLHGIRDVGLLESAVLRLRNSYYGGPIEEASALIESLANNHAFMDGNKQISFLMTDVTLRAAGYFLDVEPDEAHKFITEAMERNGFQFPMIRDWITSILRVLVNDEDGGQKKK